VLTAHINLNGVTYTTAEIDDYYQRLERAAVRYRGVESAAIAMSLPFYTSWGTQVSVPGRDSLPRVRDGGPYFNGVTTGFLRTMGMHLLRGRDFTMADENVSHRVAIVNESFARLAWPNEDAIGRCVKLGDKQTPCSEVIGVVANPRRQEIVEDVSLQLFVPLAQAPAWVDSRTLLIRTSADGGGERDAKRMIEPLRRYLQASVPNMPYLGVGWMQDLVSPQTQSWRTGAVVFGLFGALAVLLAMVGLYSMLSYDVAQRAHELGVRVALGARSADLARLVTGSGLRIVAIGAATGLGISVLAGRFVAPLLFETSPYQPAILAGAVALMLIVTIVATLLPTWRALRVDPLVALRSD
jgi:predicted permease